ncbi:solute carrier family 2, facilitated glucose transporter member 1-like isoform X2 [Littorina saxatilis]|uniref:solute carrier family 2, facilitated glucose transporter member 1-like isoform X2 n=1 Tax=Littorina saxatilis TaxID=31220 RepID=UPI0038B4AEEE
MEETTPLLSGQDSTHSLTSFDASAEVDHVGETHITKKPTLTSRLAFATAACVLCSSFLLGYNTAVVNSPEEVIEDFYNVTNYERTGSYMSKGFLTMLWGITVSCYAAGGMIGGLSAGYWANRYGRRGALLRNNLLAITAAALMGFSKMAKSYEMLIVGRIIAGINAGVSSGVAPLYLSEISPILLRGLCGTFNQVAICFGTLVAEVIGLDILLGTNTLWPVCFGFVIVPVIFQLLALPCCPETPRYLMMMKGEEDEAEKALVWLRKTEDVGEEMEEMRKEVAEHRNAVKFSVKSLFSKAELRWPLIICIVLQLAQQFSGINAVIYYSTLVFQGAGLSKTVAQYATAATGAVNVSMSFVSAVLMDKLGRRTLMMTGLGGMFVFTIVLTIALVFQVQFHGSTWRSCLLKVLAVQRSVCLSSSTGSLTSPSGLSFQNCRLP